MSEPQTGSEVEGQSVGHWHKGFPFSDTTHVAPQEQYVFSQGSEKKMRFTRGARWGMIRIVPLIHTRTYEILEKKVIGENGREIKFVRLFHAACFVEFD